MLLSLMYSPIKKLIIPTIIFYFLLIIYYFKIRPDLIVCRELKRVTISSNTRLHLIQRFCHLSNIATTANIEIVVIEAQIFSAWYLSTERKTYLFFTSSLINDFNEIDLDSVLAYLSILRSTTNALRDTSILLLATIAEKVIITSLVGAAIIHVVKPYINDALIDTLAIKRMRFAIGYRKMIEKLKTSKDNKHNIPYSIEINSIANIQKNHTFYDRWFQLHNALEKRIQSINQLNQTLS